MNKYIVSLVYIKGGTPGEVKLRMTRVKAHSEEGAIETATALLKDKMEGFELSLKSVLEVD